MAEAINTELALKLFGAICRIYNAELSDVVHVAEKLRLADDLELRVPRLIQVYQDNLIPQPHVQMNAKYVGAQAFWPLMTTQRKDSDIEARAYFDDLGKRIGLEFKDVRPLDGGDPGCVVRDGRTVSTEGFVRLCADAVAPSGEALNVLITQFYTNADKYRTSNKKKFI